MITAIYIRVSTDAQAEEGYSIEEQKERLVKYCDSRDITDYEFYIDGGFTGSNIMRPEMQRLIADCKANRIDNVIVYKLDRLSRSQKDTLYLIEEVFLPHNVGFISINESFDTTTPFGRAMIGILSVFAQLERENIRERTRMGMLGRIKEGYWPGGGRVPYGYDYNAKEGVLVPNEDAEKVRKMYDMYLRGMSPYRIADIMGMKYDRLVIQILTRKSNTGVIVYNGEEYKGKHEPIISEEIYNRAMEMMEVRSKSPSYGDTQNLLTGLVYCGICGAKMRYQKCGNRNKFYCYSKQKSKMYLVKDPDCNNISPFADEIEELVIKNMFDVGRFNVDTSQGTPEYHVSIEDELITQRKIAEQKLKRLYHLYGDGGNEMLLETIDDTKKRIIDLNNKIDKERNRTILTEKKNVVADEIMNIKGLWGHMTVKEKYSVLHEYVERIIITNTNIRIVYRD